MTISKSNQEIIAGRLIAKAVAQKNNRIEIVAVFETSEYHRFFFIFTARSRRSPRKSWKWTGAYQSIYPGMGKTHTLESYVQMRYPGQDVKIRRYIKKAYLSTFIDRTAHPYTYLEPDRKPLPGQSFEHANAITSGHRRKIAFRGGYKPH
jgi:hypothetical protein